MDTTGQTTRFTRRSLLRLLTGGAGGAMVLGVLGACQPAAPAPAPTAARAEPTRAPAAPTIQAPATATGAATPKPAVRRGGAISVASDLAPDSLIPQFYQQGRSRFMYGMLFTSLLRLTPDLQLVGWLADKWEASADATRYTFHIRDNAVWSDGKPITAEDVAFTIETMTDPGYSGLEGVLVDQIAGAAARRKGTSKDLPGVKVLNEKTVQITTAGPYSVIPTALGIEMMILPRHVLGDVAPGKMKQSPFALAPSVASGPFKFVRYLADQYLELEANERYFLGRPNLDKVTVKILKIDVAVAQLERGELDAILGDGSAIPAIEVERVKKMAHVNVTAMPGRQLQVLVLNYDSAVNPKFKDARVRRAIAHGIDLKSMLEKLFLGYGDLNTGPMNRHFPFYNESVKGYAFDPGQSKALLKEAAWDARTEMVLLYAPIYPRTEIAPVIQGYLSDVGIKVKLEQKELAQLLAGIQKEPGTLDLNLGGWKSYFDPDTYFTRFFHTKSIMNPNFARYSNPKVDALLEKGRTMVDEKDQRPIYDEIQRQIIEDVPIVPLFVLAEMAGVNKRLVGPRKTVGRVTDDMHEWYVTS